MRTVKLSQYCEQTVQLSAHWEAGRGSYDLKDNPFWADILDAMLDPDVREISIKKGTRVGGTLAGIAANLGLSDLDPAPSMIVTPDEPSGMELRDRLYDTAASSDAYRDRVPNQRLWNSRAIDLRSNIIFLAWAGSAQRLRGRTCRRVFFHEIDVYPPAIRGGGDAIRAGAQRVQRSFYSLLYYESSPDGEASRIHALHRKGNQMTWQCPCPKCGRYQELRFFTFKEGEYKGRGGLAGFKDEHDNLLSKEEAMEQAHYICLNGCRIDNHQKHPMVQKGKWVPAGCEIDDETGEVIGTPTHSRRHISCHLWAIHVPSINFSSLAEAYIDHWVENDMKEFWQNWLGLRYRTGRKPPRWDQVGRRLEGYASRGEVSVGTYFLTAGVDVQLHGCYWSVWGWGHMSRCWLIDWGYNRRFMSDTDSMADDEVEDLTYPHIASDLGQLRQAVLARKFAMFGGKNSPFGQPHMKLKGVAIDSKYRKNSVHRFVQQSLDPRILAVQGDDAVNPRDRFRRAKIERTRDGRELDQTREYYGISTTYFKSDIYDRLALDIKADQSVNFPKDMSTRGQDFLRQLMNEIQVEDKEKKKLQWKEQNNRIGSHYLDTFVYAYARAEILLATLGLSWDAGSWRNDQEPPEQQQQIAREYQR